MSRSGPLDKWADRLKKAEHIAEEEWVEFKPRKSGKTLGDHILENFLQDDGDVLEVDLDRTRRGTVGGVMKAILHSKKKLELKAEFVIRYSKDYKRAYIKRIG